MTVPEREASTAVLHEPDRLVFFSDAVVAIAMTLLALDLPVPGGKTAVQVLVQFRSHASEYGAFLLSFLVVGGAWRAHHQLFTYVNRIDAATISRNMQWLLLIVVTPFVTKLMTGGGGEGDQTSSLRLACYGFVQAMTWLTLLRIYQHLRDRELVREDARPLLRSWSERRGILIGMFLLSVPLALLAPWAGAACWIGSPFVLRGVRQVQTLRARRRER